VFTDRAIDRVGLAVGGEVLGGVVDDPVGARDLTVPAFSVLHTAVTSHDLLHAAQPPATMTSMAGAGPGRQENNGQAGLMRDGARKWILRAGRDLREISPPVLLSALCAAAFCPLIAVGAGITGAAAVAGIGVLSSVGGGVLTDVITNSIDRLRGQNAESSPSPAEIEKVLASELTWLPARRS
jgi:hypothetical protein